MRISALDLNSRILAGKTGSVSWEIKSLIDLERRRAEIDIYDVIGDPWSGTSAQGILYQLRMADVDEMLVRINSIGGVVTEGMDIYNLLCEHPANVTIRISGVAASIASIVALAGDRVEMYANSQFMIHDPYASPDPYGPPMREEDLLRNAKLLASIKGQMFKIYADKTGMDLEEIAALCRAESWFTADEAKLKGFVDAVLNDETEGSMQTVRLSAAAWNPKILNAIKAPKILRMAAQAASLPPPALAATPPKEKKMARRRKILNLSTSLASSKGGVALMLAALGKNTNKLKAEEITDEDLASLTAELEEASTRAEELEAELEETSARAAQYDEAKKALEETTSRATKAAEELEELKKKMSDMKSADGDGDDDEVDAAGDEEMSAEARTFLNGASRKVLRGIARAAVAATDSKDLEGLEGRLVALTLRGGSAKSIAAIRSELVSNMIAKGKLLPHKKAWALSTSEANLNAYLEGIGAGTLAAFSKTLTPGDEAALQHNSGTEGARASTTTPGDEIPGNPNIDRTSPEYLAAEKKIRSIMGVDRMKPRAAAAS